MFDKYIYKISNDKDFLAGYTISKISGYSHPVFLFPSLRIIRVLSGSAIWKIGTKIKLIKENDIIVVNNTEPRQFMKILQTPIECEIFAFSLSIFKYENSCLELFYNRSDEFDPIVSKFLQNTDEIHMLLNILKNRFKTSDLNTSSAKSAISTLITSIIAYMLDCIKQNHTEMLGKSTDTKNYAVDIVAHAIEYINQNISEAINVSMLAKKCNVSRGYFTKVFHRYTGSTPANFINYCRINNVIHLIYTTKINILDAAFASGFSSASGFYKTFHTVCNMTPTEYMANISDHCLI